MSFIGPIWNLINKNHTGFIGKEANIRPNVRDSVIDKDQEKQWSQDWFLWVSPEDNIFHWELAQTEQHVAVDQLSSFWTIYVVRRKRLYT